MTIRQQRERGKRIISHPPGSDKAVDAGCICPILDNNHGEGVGYDGRQQYWMTANCPLHGTGDKEASDE